MNSLICQIRMTDIDIKIQKIRNKKLSNNKIKGQGGWVKTYLKSDVRESTSSIGEMKTNENIKNVLI